MAPIPSTNVKRLGRVLPIFLAVVSGMGVVAAEGPLRHAVFFQYHADSYPGGADEVREAFDALPGKIDEIQKYQRGTNTHRGLDAGLTDAFLLSFDNAADRDAYLVHPDHQAFGGVLRPHLRQAFVIDYVGETEDIATPHLKHMVFFKFEPDADGTAVRSVVEQFLRLEDEIGTVRHLEHGTNVSPEAHDQGFTHAFLVVFDDPEGLKTYGPHPAHQELIRLMDGVVAETRVIDFMVD